MTTGGAIGVDTTNNVKFKTENKKQREKERDLKIQRDKYKRIINNKVKQNEKKNMYIISNTYN